MHTLRRQESTDVRSVRHVLDSLRTGVFEDMLDLIGRDITIIDWHAIHDMTAGYVGDRVWLQVVFENKNALERVVDNDRD